jgi:hypothetical protein
MRNALFPLVPARGLMFGLVLVASCAKAPPASRATGPSSAAMAAAPTQAGAPQAALQTEKKPRIGEAALYVDGKPIAAIRALEIPAGLRTHEVDTAGYVTKRYWMGEYLKALGIDTSKIKAFHVYGGARVSVLDGAEFQRVQNGIQFSFSQGDRGKPRIMFAVANLKVNTTVDMIGAIAIYVDKEPPTLHEGHLAFADGKEIEGIPYAPAEMSKGTRVYVDGKLAATVKRKELPTDLVVDADVGNANPHYSLAGYLKTIGVDATNAKSMDFVSGDDVILRMDSKTKDADKASFTFTLPRHNQGQIAVSAGAAKSAKVSALQVFLKTPPPARTIVPAEDDVRNDANRGSGQGQGQGGGGADDEL